MTDLITEARELLRRAKTYLEATDGQRLGHLLRDGYDARYAELVCFSVAHLAELCDALEKAEEQNKQLIHEVCNLACESVGREKTLARLEAEVMAACNSVRWVPVTEQLPTERSYYLTVVKRIAPDELGGNNTRVKIMRWMGEDWRYAFHFPKWINDEITETVTHWMPIPAAPEEGGTT